MSKTLHRTLQAKMAALEGPEWDSSDEEGAALVVPKKNATVETKATKKKADALTNKKEKKKSKTPSNKETPNPSQKADNNDDKPQENEEDLVLYIGHLPKEFEEKDLINFLSQFGKVHNCRVSRKVATGNSRGYAFVRFAEADVCQIVCDTLHGYFLGQQRLVCQVRPAHKSMFYNTDSVIQRRIQRKQVQKKQRDRNLANLEKLKEITARLVSREEKKRQQLESMGIEYDFPGYKTNQEELEVRQKSTSVDEDNKDKSIRKRSDSVGSEGSAKKKKKKRKESIDSVESASKRARKDLVNSEESAKTSKRKESIDSLESSEVKQSKKKRKDSINSQGDAKKQDSDASNLSLEEEAATSPSKEPPQASTKAKKKNRKDSDASKLSLGVVTEKIESKDVSQSAKKAKRKKKDKKRRQSAP